MWNQKVPGFTTHTFSDDYTSLRTEYVSYKGEVLHSFSVKRGVRPKPPRPGPAGRCCFYHTAECAEGSVCCKSDCTDPSTCSYSKSACDGRYGRKHGCAWRDGHCVVERRALS